MIRDADEGAFAADRLEKLFAAALEHDASRREVFLDETCGSDHRLRARLDALLAAYEKSADMLEHSPVEGKIWSEALPEDAEGLPRTIGRYRIRQVLATGGMGTVYEAEQESPRRTVAIKVLRWSLTSGEARRRFRYESEVLARLSHPGIAQVLETGTCREGAIEVPFFAMEFIPRARPITRYAEDERLTTRQRLELFAQVCDAVHYGHQHGVIHRDLKPSNILVDDEGRARLIDFGVARSTEAEVAMTTQTKAGELLGTLQYMSPEQCAGDPHGIDMRSDVYALGVVLYELLCGKLPYDLGGLAVQDATRVVREHVPSRVSTVDAQLRGDLDTVVAKALEKERDRRYASVAQLAGDICRYLAGEAILAHPSSALYYLRVFARRNKALVAGMAAVFAVLLAGAIVSTSLYFRAERARVEEGKLSTLLEKAFDSIDPYESLVVEISARELVDTLVQKLETDVVFPENSPSEARLRATIGRTYMNLGKYDAAQPHLERALAIRRAVWGSDHEEVAESLYDLAMLMAGPAQGLPGTGDSSRGEELFRESLAIRRRVLGSTHEKVAESLRALGRLVGTMQILKGEPGNPLAAEELLREALTISRNLDRPRPLLVAEIQGDLADVLRLKGCVQEAQSLAFQALNVRIRLLGDEHLRVAESLHMLAVTQPHPAVLPNSARVPLFREALAMRRRLLRNDHVLVALSLGTLGRNLLSMGEHGEGELLVCEAIEIYRDVFGNDFWRIRALRTRLGLSFMSSGRFTEAERELLLAFYVCRSTYGERDSRTIRSAVRLALLYEHWTGEGQVRGQLAEVEAVLRLAVENAQPPVDVHHYARGICLWRMGRDTEAERHLREARQLGFVKQDGIREALVGIHGGCDRLGEGPEASDLAIGNCQKQLGRYYRTTGRYREARDELLDAHRILSSAAGKRSALTMQTVEELVALYEAWDEPEEAAKWRARLAEVTPRDEK